jgi:hypothetical protein
MSVSAIQRNFITGLIILCSLGIPQKAAAQSEEDIIILKYVMKLSHEIYNIPLEGITNNAVKRYYLTQIENVNPEYAIITKKRALKALAEAGEIKNLLIEIIEQYIEQEPENKRSAMKSILQSWLTAVEKEAIYDIYRGHFPEKKEMNYDYYDYSDYSYDYTSFDDSE